MNTPVTATDSALPAPSDETSDYYFEREQKLAGSIPGELLLPMIRRTIAAGSSAADRLDDVLAIYPGRLVIMTVRRKAQFQDAAFALYGTEALLQMESVGGVFIARWDEIASIRWSRTRGIGSRFKFTSDIGREFRITMLDGRETRCFLPEEDAAMVMIAFERLALEKTTEVKKLPWFKQGKSPLRRKASSPCLRVIGWLVVLLLAFIAAKEAVEAMLNGTGWNGVVSAWKAIEWESVGPLAFVPVIFFFILQVAARAVCPSQKREFRRRRKLYLSKKAGRKVKDMSGRLPFRSGSAGLLLKLIGGCFLFTGLVIHGMVNIAKDLEFPLASVLFAGPFYAGAALFAVLGFRLSLRPLKDVVQAAGNRPVVFLRPFDVDRSQDFNPDSPMTQLVGLKPLPLIRFLGPLASCHPLRVLRLILSRTAERAEEQMASFFRKLGPFVAIGRPGDNLLLAGAERAYVADEDWQTVVQQWLGGASFVVLQPGTTEGVAWEIEQSFSILSCERVLVCLAHIQGSQARWDAVRLAMHLRISDVELPRVVRDAPFIHFTASGVPERLPRIMHHPFFWPWTGRCLDFERTLVPFLQKLGIPSKHAERGGRRVPGWVESVVSIFATNAAFFAVPVLCVFLSLASIVSVVKMIGTHAPMWMTELAESVETLQPDIRTTARSNQTEEESGKLLSVEPSEGWTLKTTGEQGAQYYAEEESGIVVSVLARPFTDEEKEDGPGDAIQAFAIEVSGGKNTELKHLEDRKRLLEDEAWDEDDFEIVGANQMLRIRTRVAEEEVLVVFGVLVPAKLGLAGFKTAEEFIEGVNIEIPEPSPMSPEEALEYLKPIQSAYQDDPSEDNKTELVSALAKAAWSYLLSDQFAPAKGFCEQALQLDPSDLNAKVNLAHAILFEGKLGAAIKVYRELVDEHEEYGESAIDDDFEMFEKQNIHLKEVEQVREALNLKKSTSDSTPELSTE